MGVFKEEAHAFETLEKNQEQIYNDAADIGYAYDSKNPSIFVSGVIESINTFKKLDKEYPNEKPLITKRTVLNTGEVNLTIQIAWEIDCGMEYGTQYDISYVNTSKHFTRINKLYNAFISIQSKRYQVLVK